MSQPTNPLLQYYQQWREKTPFVTRTSIIWMVAVYIVSIFFSADKYLGNVPFFTITQFEIYRIIFSPLVGNSILTLILILMIYPMMGTKMEHSMGSSTFLWLFGMISLSTNVIFNILALMFYVLGTPEAMFWNCSGIWTILFGLITIDCMLVPDAPRRIMFVPVDIPSKYMPLALFGLFALFGGFQLSYIISISLGYAYFSGYLDRFRPTSQYFESLESTGGLFHSLSRNPGWMLAGTLGHDAWVPTNAGQAVPSAPPQQSSWQQGTTFAQPPRETSGEPKELFPGSGHKLDAASGGGSLFSVPTTSSSHGPSREELAARRLAALNKGSGGNVTNV